MVQRREKMGFWFGIQMARQPRVGAEIHIPSPRKRVQETVGVWMHPSAPPAGVYPLPSGFTASQHVGWSTHPQSNTGDSLLNGGQQVHICTFSVGGPDKACGPGVQKRRVIALRDAEGGGEATRRHENWPPKGSACQPFAVNGFAKAAVFSYINGRLYPNRLVFTVALSVSQLIVWL